MTKRYEHRLMTIPMGSLIYEGDIAAIGEQGFCLVGSVELWQTDYINGTPLSAPAGSQLIFEKEVDDDRPE